jgi:regulator of sirC expression with transglutaminase-like and TPR domain
MTISNQELAALVKLMDDQDAEISHIVNAKLDKAGVTLIPQLEELWENSGDNEYRDKIEGLISNLYDDDVAGKLHHWYTQDSHDLMKMLVLVSRIKYPGLDGQNAHDFMGNISTDAWINLYASAHDTDKVQVLNSVIFGKYGLHGDSETYNHPDNSFITRMAETRKGNPITLSCLYIVVAHRLGLPVFGVNLPQHFVVAYCNPGTVKISDYVKQNRILNRQDFGEVLFYINPFNQGKIFSKENLQTFLETIKVKPMQQFLETCSNTDIYLRILRNLHYAMGEQNDTAKQKFIERLQAQCEP